jgi:DNA replication and repair protein RecF
VEQQVRIDSLDITDFRVLERLLLQPAPGINLICGDNGAGKTSVLEAVFLAARGRSFRHQEAGPFIRSGATRAQVVVHLTSDQGVGHILGVERGTREQRVRLDSQTIERRSQQVRALPLQVVTPNSHALLEGPPELRRRYLDLGLFHVEHGYHRWYGDYQRALRQRNAALRGHPQIARSWDKQLAELAGELSGARQRFIERLDVELQEILARVAPALQVRLAHRPGWDPAGDLAEQLSERWDQDQRQGFTGIGPHRADLVVQAAQVNAAKRLSRGQQKLVVIGLLLAQTVLQKAGAGESPVLLLDDLPAELDGGHRARVSAELVACQCQALITSVDPSSLPVASDWAVFHVEQGVHLKA